MNDRVNLIPVSLLRRQVLVVRLRQWASAVAIMTLVLGILCAVNWTNQQNALLRRHSLEQRVLVVKQMEKEARELQTNLKLLESYAKSWDELEDSVSSTSLLGLVSLAAREVQGEVSVRAFSAQQGRPMDNDRRQIESDELSDSNVLTLEGVASSRVVIGQFTAVLRETSVFEKVNIRSLKSQELNGVSVYAYELECHYFGKAST